MNRALVAAKLQSRAASSAPFLAGPASSNPRLVIAPLSRPVIRRSLALPGKDAFEKASGTDRQKIGERPDRRFVPSNRRFATGSDDSRPRRWRVAAPPA
jgi:hypothetical protein